MINEEIDYTKKISNFNRTVGNNNDDIAIEFLTLANWDETQAIKSYLNNVSLPNNSNSDSNNNDLICLGECYINLDFGYVSKAFSFFKTKLNINKDNYEYCKYFEGKIQGLVKDPIIFMNSLKINKGIIILYNLDTRQKLMNQLEEINKDSQKDNYLKKVIIFPIIDLSKEGKDIIKQLSIVRFPCYLICKYKTENIFKVLDKIEGIFYLDLFKNTVFPNKNFSYNSSVNINQISNKKNLASENNNQKNHNSSINLKNNINLSNQYYDNSNSKNDLKDNNNKNIPYNNLKQNNNIIKESKNNNNISNDNIINKFGNLNDISFPENINNNFSLLNEENDVQSQNMNNNYNQNSKNYKYNTNNIIDKNNINKNNDNNINSNIKIKKNEIKDNNNSINNNNNFVQNKDIDIFNINNINNHKENSAVNNSGNIKSINHNDNNQNINNNQIINNKQINISKDNLSSDKNMSNKKEEPKIEKKEYIPDYRDYDFGDELAYYPELERMYQFPNAFDNTYNNPYNSQNKINSLSDAEIRNLQDKEMKELERIEEERIKKEKEEKEKKKREEQIEREKIEKEKEEKALFSMLVPKEPEDNNPDKCIIIFRMPDGEKNIQRKFLKTDKISVLYDYIRSLGKEIYTEEEYHNFSIIQTFPFKNFDDKINNTLEEE